VLAPSFIGRYLALVAYSSDVRTLVRPQPVGKRPRHRTPIESIGAPVGTRRSAGVSQGASELRSIAKAMTRDRIVLL